jgi:hypothetical protein
MDLRSDILGALSARDGYEVGDYGIPSVPDPLLDSDDAAAIRIQKLAFKPVPADPDSERKPLKGAKLYDAAVVFAFAGQNLPIRLKHDADFVHAPACENGPHVLWRGYRTRSVGVDGGLRDLQGVKDRRRRSSRGVAGMGLPSSRALALALGTSGGGRGARGGQAQQQQMQQQRQDEYYHYDIYERDWDQVDDSGPGTEHLRYYLNGAGGSPRLALPGPRGENDDDDDREDYDDDDEDSVLLIDSSGVSDNEVFARAWCAHWGEDAIVANMRETCIACAVREAKAALLRVVILTEGGREVERDQGVWDEMSVMG